MSKTFMNARNLFRSIVFAVGTVALAPLLSAGQIYGTVTSAGKPVAGAAVTITCSGAETKGATTADGSYRVNVTPQGRCTFTLPSYMGSPSVLVFSHDKPALYDLDLTKKSDGNYELKVR